MVNINTVRTVNEGLVKAQPIVAVFVGATGGIGEASIRALAATHSTKGKGLRAYIVGRNASAAQKIISDCERICPAGQFRFLKAEDLSLLKNVDLACEELMSAEKKEEESGRGKARIDFLVQTQAYLAIGEARKETTEGLDAKMSLLYYSRMRFIINLLPLLLASPLPAHIVSVFAAGMERKLYPDDLSLRNPKHYQGWGDIRTHVVYMTTLLMEELAKKYEGKLALSHVFPGLVIHESFDNSVPKWLRVPWKYFLAPVLRVFIAVPVEECGQRIVFLASARYPAMNTSEGDGNGMTQVNGVGDLKVATGSDGEVGSGAYPVNWNGETIPVEKAYKGLEAGISQKVWEHTMSAFEVIEKGGVFSG